jgi:hypothetical protein
MQEAAVLQTDEYFSRMGVHPVTVATLRDLSEVEGLRECWSRWQWHPNADIDFYQDIVRSWQARCRPHVLVLYKNGIPDAILVGRAENTKIECKIGYKTLWNIKARQLTFIYGGQLGNFSSENCTIFFKEIMESLRRKDADVAEFHFLRTDSALHTLVSGVQVGLGRDFAPCVQVHRSTELPSSSQEFYGTLSGKVRKNQRWQAKKIIQEFDGDVTIRCYRDAGDIAQMFRDIEKVAAKTYQRQLGVGFETTQELHDRLSAEAGRGRLRAYVLYLRGEPAAFWIGTVYRNTLYSDFMGYDPAYGKYSPGMYLVVKSVEELCDLRSKEPVRCIDWGLGDAQYKEVLGGSSWTESQIQVFGPTAKGVGATLLRTPIALTDLFLKRALSRSGALQRVKTRWRNHLRQKEASSTELPGRESGAGLTAPNRQ